ncbi:MAG TPA: hypothetical protein VIM86_15570, partial [Thermodesulfobacteriota bacterium]
MRAFAAACEAVGATRSRLAKRAALVAYLASLDDASLPVACTFLAGRPFPPRDPRSLGLGYAGLRAALAGAAALDPAAIDAETLRTGDLGTAAERLLAGQQHAAAAAEASRRQGDEAEGPDAARTGVTLLDARAAFDRIAAARGPGARAARLGALLHRASPVEA